MDGNLYSLFARRFAAAGDRPALVDANGAGPAFRELDTLAAQFATVLALYGVKPGDRIVVQVEKSIGAVALYLACLRIGAVFVPLNTAYTPAEVDYFIADSEPALFVSRKESKHRDTPTIVLGVDETSLLWSQARASEPLPDIAPRAADDLAAILYTSGTTGRSKGAMLSHGNLASNALTLHRLWGFEPEDVLIHALPIFHVHGLFVALHTMLLNGSTTIFLPKFDPNEVIALLPRATVMMGVPTFYTRLLAEPALTRAAAANMRLFISGSAPLLAETHRAFEERTGHRILERYGMTEAGMITSNPLDGARVPGTVGFALPDVDLRVMDEHEQPVPAGEPGILQVRGPNVFKGYWRNPEKTAEEFRDGGWFVTGDIVRQSADGRIEIVGRAKDLIIAGGFNIYPKEIEEAVDAVDGVEESAVIGVPHPDLGEAVVAVVAQRKDAGVTEAAVLAAIAERLARFKQPRRVIVVEALPRNAMGKVQKSALRQTYQHLFSAP
ncbi:MAG TPA: malonyl-CoA synthase [Caulobacterales bacterium]|nr:malonyl-CoA synthase [Caulobacterales bacterium]